MELTTDKEKLMALLTEFEIGFEQGGVPGMRGNNNVICREGQAKINGYSMFCTVFEFDKDGRFIQMGAWE